jgi:hypothetical protein
MLGRGETWDHANELYKQRQALVEELRHAFIALGVAGNNTEAARILIRTKEILGYDPKWFVFNSGTPL